MDNHIFTTHHQSNVNSLIQHLVLFLTGIFILLFPLIISSQSTNPFFLPKEAFLLLFVLISLLLWGIKMITEGTVWIRRTPFDIPVIAFGVIGLISSILAVNRYDSLTAFVPFASIIFLYFIIINLTRRENAILFLISSLIASGVVLSLLTVTSFFHMYLLPMAYAHDPSFTLMGSYLEQALYLACIIPIAGYIGYPLLKRKANGQVVIFSMSTVIIVLGLLVSIINLVTIQKPVILPFETGFQIAFAAISQDAGRIFQGFFFGSGFGTFFTDFTRFKLASFNNNQNLWYLTFSQSSSLILEILTTTGILGFLAFLVIILKIFRRSSTLLKNPLTISLFLISIIAFALPMGFTTLTLLFILLALFAAIEALHQHKEYYDLELRTVAYKKGGNASHTSQPGLSMVVSIMLCIVLLLIVGVLTYFGTNFMLSDIDFQKSLIAAEQNNGYQTYQYQHQAIQEFSFRDMYYRGFSQTNLALANSIAALANGNKKLTQQQQQTLYALIQQSINTGRTAASISPQTVLNWQNLSSIYRSLIGFGQNAEQFAILTNRQAIALDPTNPQEYIALGGLYYQLQQYDTAITNFQIAANLKPDFANAYYNWGHALEMKNDLPDALSAYQTVRALVANDPANKQKIDGEIAALQQKIKVNSQNTKQQSNQTNQQPNAANQQPLSVNTPQNVLPTRNPQLKIPGPSVATPRPAKNVQTTSPTVAP